MKINIQLLFVVILLTYCTCNTTHRDPVAIANKRNQVYNLWQIYVRPQCSTCVLIYNGDDQILMSVDLSEVEAYFQDLRFELEALQKQKDQSEKYKVFVDSSFKHKDAISILHFFPDFSISPKDIMIDKPKAFPYEFYLRP